jgi:hypothetical protein
MLKMENELREKKRKGSLIIDVEITRPPFVLCFCTPNPSDDAPEGKL